MLRKLIVAGVVVVAFLTLGTAGVIHLLEQGRDAIRDATSDLGTSVGEPPADRPGGDGSDLTNVQSPDPTADEDAGPSPTAGSPRTSAQSDSQDHDSYVLTTTGVGKGGPTGSAAKVLDTLTVKGKSPMTGYDRTKDFGPAWTDRTDAPLSGDHCDTRNNILQRDLVDETFRDDDPDCTVATGILSDPYTHKVIHFVRGVGTSSDVQIDHSVALGNVWVSGGQKLTQAQREAIANDPLNLLAVDGPANESKGDSNAAEWLPPNKSYRCSYVARQIAVKSKYHLSVTKPEKHAMERVLTKCPSQGLPTE